jgi:hypothetical protein
MNLVLQLMLGLCICGLALTITTPYLAMDYPDDDIAKRIIAHISSLPPEEQAAAIHNLVAQAMKAMSKDEILNIRKEILSEFHPCIPIVESTLNLIEGHLALREINPQ